MTLEIKFAPRDSAKMCRRADLAADVLAVQFLIRQDVVEGIVPTDVADFSELHDYVDANEYLLAAPCFKAVYDASADADGWIPAANALTARLDAWIRDGGLRSD